MSVRNGKKSDIYHNALNYIIITIAPKMTPTNFHQKKEIILFFW